MYVVCYDVCVCIYILSCAGVCMYVCACKKTTVETTACPCVDMSMWVHSSDTNLKGFVRACVRVCVCLSACVFTYTHTYILHDGTRSGRLETVCLYVWMYAHSFCMWMYAYVCIRKQHTHTHIKDI